MCKVLSAGSFRVADFDWDVTPLRDTRRKGLSDLHRQVAERFRSERETERFSQYELAAELGITRAALSNFELCQAPLSFAVGFEFCRRLDLSPRWLAIGTEPKRPFVPLSDLGLSQGELRKYSRRGIDFISGFEGLLKRPLDAWIKENPSEKIIGRMFRGGIEPLARRWSNGELIEQLRQAVAGLKSSDAALHSGYAGNVEALIAEISARLVTRRPGRRK